MQVQSLLELIKSGNASAAAQQWSTVVEAADADPGRLAAYDCVLEELVRGGKTGLAEELAWTAIETAMAKHPPAAVLPMAAPFLLAVGESETLRKEVSDLYRSAYAEREGIEALLAEAGIHGARPVRRALRTLDVCLAIDTGSYLAARDEDGAARVEAVERPAWRFTLSVPSGEETLAAVTLADRYRPAARGDFRVQRQFDRESLTRRLWDDPASLLLELCRGREKSLDDADLQALLVPDLLSTGEWKKWWTQARSALKRCPNIQLEGRAPCKLVYVHAPSAAHEGMLGEFERQRDPLEKLAIVERYIRDSKLRSEQPDVPALRACLDQLLAKAESTSAAHAAVAAHWWIAARRTAELTGVERSWSAAIACFKSLQDVHRVFRSLESDALFVIAADWLAAADPEHWQSKLLHALPKLPHVVCDHVAARLVKAGFGPADFAPAIDAVLASPVAHFEALLWLWDGPTRTDALPVPPLPILVSRLLRTLDDCRRNDALPKEAAREIGAAARSVLAARQYIRFRECLDQLDATVAHTYARLIRQLDSLGKAVPEDLVSLIRRKFPPALDAAKEIYPWENDSVIYVTSAGLAKKQDEIHHHVNVTMKANSVAIGRAAEHGDLSENSEYKFALEERDLLRARLAQMNAEVAASRVLSPGDVPTDYVGIGTRVTLERVTDNHRYEMTLVGPWEAESATRLFNYKTPLAAKILGKRVGDILEFEHTGAVGTYRIVFLENALVTGLQTPSAAPVT